MARCTGLAVALLASCTRAQLTCNFGGSSDSSSDNRQIPSTCTSYDTYQPAIETTIPPWNLYGETCGVDSRCVTVTYQVTQDGAYKDYVALGCIPNYMPDAMIAAQLDAPDSRNGDKFIGVVSCPNSTCNKCSAAINQPGFWWHVYGHAIVGTAITLLFCVGFCITACVWLVRKNENRRNALRYQVTVHTESTPLMRQHSQSNAPDSWPQPPPLYSADSAPLPAYPAPPAEQAYPPPTIPPDSAPSYTAKQ
eukprot:m.69497 g.69497  ORF g.69497 m.69497 type:complete len:251 (+) comp9969_c0_seq1:110-862(+)